LIVNVQRKQQQLLAQKQQQLQAGQGTAVAINQPTAVVNQQQQQQAAGSDAVGPAAVGIQQVHSITQQQGLIVLNKTSSAAPVADQATLVQQIRFQQLMQQQQQQHGALAAAATVQVRPTSITLPTTTQYAQQQNQQVRYSQFSDGALLLQFSLVTEFMFHVVL